MQAISVFHKTTTSDERGCRLGFHLGGVLPVRKALFLLQNRVRHEYENGQNALLYVFVLLMIGESPSGENFMRAIHDRGGSLERRTY